MESQTALYNTPQPVLKNFTTISRFKANYTSDCINKNILLGYIFIGMCYKYEYLHYKKKKSENYDMKPRTTNCWWWLLIFFESIYCVKNYEYQNVKRIEFTQAIILKTANNKKTWTCLVQRSTYKQHLKWGDLNQAYIHTVQLFAYDAGTEGPARVSVFSPLCLLFLWMALLVHTYTCPHYHTLTHSAHTHGPSSFLYFLRCFFWHPRKLQSLWLLFVPQTIRVKIWVEYFSIRCLFVSLSSISLIVSGIMLWVSSLSFSFLVTPRCTK